MFVLDFSINMTFHLLCRFFHDTASNDDFFAIYDEAYDDNNEYNDAHDEGYSSTRGVPFAISHHVSTNANDHKQSHANGKDSCENHGFGKVSQ